MHVPLIIRVPWKPASHGQRTNVKAELVDLYRTLVDLTGLTGVQEDVQGMSLAPVFDAPTAPPPALASKVAFSQIGRCNCTYYPAYNIKQCAANACCRVSRDRKTRRWQGLN